MRLPAFPATVASPNTCKRSLRIARGVTTAIALLAMIACGDPDDDVLVKQSVRLVNNDVVPVHLFKEGEDFPCCQVAPGASRVTSFGYESQLLTITHSFRAGRNGTILNNVTCTLNTRGQPEVSVVFGGGGLACTGW